MSASLCNYGCGTLSQHQQVQCGDYILGGIPSIAILECDNAITDFSNASQWTTAINTGRARIIKGIAAEIADPSPVEGESAVACGPENETYTFDWVLSYMDHNSTAQNDLFYDGLKTRRFRIAYYSCDDDTVRVVDAICNVTNASLVKPKRQGEREHYSVSIKWRSLNNPRRFAAPAGIF